MRSNKELIDIVDYNRKKYNDKRQRLASKYQQKFISKCKKYIEKELVKASKSGCRFVKARLSDEFKRKTLKLKHRDCLEYQERRDAIHEILNWFNENGFNAYSNYFGNCEVITVSIPKLNEDNNDL